MDDLVVMQGSGITVMKGRSIKPGTPEWEDYVRRTTGPDVWKYYFFDLDWLRTELETVKKLEPDRPELFLPSDGWGWFISRLLANTEMLHGAVADGDAALAATYACEAGRLMEQVQMKFNPFKHEKTVEQLALSGLSTVEGAKRGGAAPRAKSERVALKQQPLLDAYWRSRNSGGLHETAMDRAVKATGYSRRQALRILGPLK